MKKNKFLMLLALAFFLFGCRTELSDDLDSHISQSDYRKTVKLKEALAFKNYLTEAKSNSSQVYNKNADFLSALSDESIVTVIVQNNVTSYSTVIKHLDRSSDVLVYSIDNENKSIGFTAKYTPEDRTKNYQIDNFTGTVEFTSMDGRSMGIKELSNGVPLPDKVPASKNFMNKAGCSFSIRLIEVECNGEHHSPSQIAQCTASQKPYYIVEITEVCSGGGQPPKGFPNMGTYDGGGSSTGGGTTNEMTIQDSFNYMLGEAGFPELTADEYTYIQNNQYIGGQLLSYFYNNLSPNNIQFLHWVISYFKNNPLSGSPSVVWRQFQDWFLTDIPNDFLQQVVLENPTTILNYESLQSPSFKMRKIDQLKYPKFTTIIKNLKTEIQNNPTTLNRLVQLTGLTEQQVLESLTFGQGPTIKLIPNLMGPSGPNYGNFDHTNPTNININLNFVLGLEQASLSTTRHATAFLLAVTVLHEFVHFGNYISGYDPNGNEMGNLFEISIYGIIVTHLNAGNYIIQLK
ncbi:hypothetical protein [Chryseobacterium indologenes]|uniref:hypothetical protein n=1 Tax=Chryseobacterium indologenes TaxID=253 RepID=UPI0009A1C72A|nr:hypothetical protein [Chryseobacterium indologenes]